MIEHRAQRYDEGRRGHDDRGGPRVRPARGKAIHAEEDASEDDPCKDTLHCMYPPM